MRGTYRIGTCSWKYDSWRGLVYSDTPGINYLAEYAQKYDCVEVDQWFWSLYGPDKVVLPQPRTVAEYAASVPDSFRFGVKLPNALTLTHFRPAGPSRGKSAEPLVPNPHFLSADLLKQFLDRLAPLRSKLGPLMFQFGYLNRKMMPSQAEFLRQLDAFVGRLPAGYTWCVETRNPNYLNDAYFGFLKDHGLGHVWLQGYYMPPIFDLYAKYADRLVADAVIRLHGPDREGMEERTGEDWSKIVVPRDGDLTALAAVIRKVKGGNRGLWMFINNHYEGSAPQTIARIMKMLE